MPSQVEEMSMGEFVRVEAENGVATIRLDRPKMNAIDGQLQTELIEAAREVSADGSVRAVILYGGGRGFAAGGARKGKGAPAPPPRARDPRAPPALTPALARHLHTGQPT